MYGLPEGKDIRFECGRVGQEKVPPTVVESSDILRGERDEIVAGDPARDVNLRSELDADSVVDVDCGCGETSVRDAS